jgi:hypothetical protein
MAVNFKIVSPVDATVSFTISIDPVAKINGFSELIDNLVNNLKPMEREITFEEDFPNDMVELFLMLLQYSRSKLLPITWNRSLAVLSIKYDISVFINCYGHLAENEIKKLQIILRKPNPIYIKEAILNVDSEKNHCFRGESGVLKQHHRFDLKKYSIQIAPLILDKIGITVDQKQAF